MDENLARLNKLYPNGKYVHIQAYDPETWKDREYDSGFDTKAALNKWASKPLSYEEAQQLVEKGDRIGWIIPKGYVIIDIDNKDNPRTQTVIEKLLQKWEVNYAYNYTSKGIHLLFKDTPRDIKSNSRMKCGLNILIDTRANETGYIVLPSNDPHREWGKWPEIIEEVPYFLKPLLKDNTPSFIGMGDGDGRNDALFKWRSRLETQPNKISPAEIEKCIKIINEYLFDVSLPNSELYKTVLRSKDVVKQFEQEKKGNKFNQIAEELCNKYNLIAYKDYFYMWNGTYYKEIDKIVLEQLIYNEVSKNITAAGRTEIIQFIKIKCQHAYEELNSDWYKIAVKNGVLNLITGEVTVANPSELNTVGIDVKYDPDPPYSPRIDEFMKQLTGGNLLKEKFLYQVAGYCLLKKNIFAKFVMFQGDGGTGKSTFMNLIQLMVGGQNCSHVGLPDFDRDYYLSTIFGKLVNIDDDVVDGKSLQYTGRFKSIVSGDRISTRQIYHEVIEFTPFCTCIFSCNKLPLIMDDTSGLYRRLILVELNNKVDRPDPLFIAKTTTADLEYFLFKAVEGIKEAIEQGQFVITDSEEKLLAKFKRRQSSLLEWLAENNITRGDLVGKKVISMYSQYKAWTDDNGFNKKLTSISFKDNLCKLYDIDIDMLKDEKGHSQGMGFVKRGEFDPNYKPF